MGPLPLAIIEITPELTSRIATLRSMNDDLIHRSSHINRESLVHRSDGKPTDGAMCPWKTAGVDVACPGTFAISYAHGPQIVASHSEDKKWLNSEMCIKASSYSRFRSPGL